MKKIKLFEAFGKPEKPIKRPPITSPGLGEITKLIKEAGYEISSRSKEGGIRHWYYVKTDEKKRFSEAQNNRCWKALGALIGKVKGVVNKPFLGQYTMSGPNFGITKQNYGIHLHYTKKESDNFKRKIGYEGDEEF